MWTPVIDVSQYQGKIDFAKMRRTGVRGVIMRATHGLTEDRRLVEHVRGARAGGYRDRDLGFYTFLNPKRGSAVASARATVDAIRRALGHLDTFYMVDVEDYAPYTPNPGDAPWFGERYAEWIKDHIAEVRRRAPDARVVAYSNRSYWNGRVRPGQDAPVWVGDDRLARQLDWMVARYPVYPDSATRSDPVALERWIRESPKPGTPPSWDEWAFEQEPDGPIPPVGADWDGWQFSADYNRRGPTYGCSSPDVDLNIVRTASWERWTRPARSGGGSGPGGTITVRPGDGWFRLAQRGLGDPLRWRELAALNGGVDRMLHPGDVLRLPGGSGGSGGGSGGSGGGSGGSGGSRTVTVRPGDSWFAIAQRELGSGTRWREIARLNGGEQRVIHPGDVLRLPGGSGGSGGGSGGSGGGSGGSGGSGGGRTVTVRPGDSWFRIAQRELGSGTRWREIARLNGGEQRVIHPGDVLRLP